MSFVESVPHAAELCYKLQSHHTRKCQTEGCLFPPLYCTRPTAGYPACQGVTRLALQPPSCRLTSSRPGTRRSGKFGLYASYAERGGAAVYTQCAGGTSAGFKAPAAISSARYRAIAAFPAWFSTLSCSCFRPCSFYPVCSGPQPLPPRCRFASSRSMDWGRGQVLRWHILSIRPYFGSQTPRTLCLGICWHSQPNQVA